MTAVPDETRLPLRVPGRLAVTGNPVLLKVIVPVVPPVEVADMVPPTFTLRAALALLAIVMEPPAPVPGADAETLPVIPLVVTGDPTTNGFVGSL